MSLREDARRQLQAWSAPTTAEEALHTRFLDLLASTPDAMWRSAYPDHLTAGALVVDDGGDHVLLNLHRKARRWFAFGGHAEPADATLFSVAAREAAEESGLGAAELTFAPEPLQLDVHPVPFCDPRGEVHHLDVRYGARAADRSGERTSTESLDVRWWPVADLPELEPSMLTLIARTRDRLC